MPAETAMASALVLCRLERAMQARPGSNVASWMSRVAPEPARSSAAHGRVSPTREGVRVCGPK